jgi:flagellar hook-basal body complex protein FliE
MPAPILPVSAPVLPEVSAPATAGVGAGSGSFQEVLTSAIQSVESFGQQASASVGRFLAGEGEELHTTVMASQRAELSFELFQEVRSKVVNAYQEIMRMQM